MPKSTRGKSTARKPLRDISKGGKRPIVPREEDGDDVALDRLLLVRSDLSNLISQIDELVVEALDRKTISKSGNQAVKSFMHVLSDMHSSLKAWVPRLQQALGSNAIATSKLGLLIPTNSDSANGEGTADRLGQKHKNSFVSVVNEERDTSPSEEHDTDLGLIVSPSPLVSWRPGTCAIESGRQLFLLTPLPKSKFLSSKGRSSIRSRLVECSEKDPHYEALRLDTLSANVSYACDKTVEAKNASENELSSPLLLTPCLKLSPPKTCRLLEPICESSLQDVSDKTETQVSDSSESEVIASLASKYQELFCFQPNQNFANRRREVDGSLDWFLSPPKTCVLMEPSDEKAIPAPANTIVLATPMPKNLQSSVRQGKPPGENTLKKELWTKFEAVSTSGMDFNASVFHKAARKGFLDMLEEVSCETTGLESQDAR